MLQPTFAPTATPAPASDASSNNALPLLGFGAMAAALAIGYTLVRRKRDA
jgi:LPXTG-motif cell wall-anchored protein